MTIAHICNVIEMACGLISFTGMALTIKFARDSRRYRRQAERSLEQIKLREINMTKTAVAAPEPLPRCGMHDLKGRPCPNPVAASIHPDYADWPLCLAHARMIRKARSELEAQRRP